MESDKVREMPRIHTKVFDIAAQRGFATSRALADAMGLHESQISRVKRGESEIGEQFIRGALQAFPDLSLDDLFTVDREPAGVC